MALQYSIDYYVIIGVAVHSAVAIYSLRNVERRPVLCSFKRIEGGLSKKSLKKNPSLHPPLVRGFTAQQL